MKLYYAPGACSLAIRIVINEIGTNCEYEKVDLKNKQTESGADFLKINPKGYVPTLVLDNQEILTENAVIQQYLADTYKATQLLPPLEDIQRYHTLEWLQYIATELHKGAGPLFNTNYSEDTRKKIIIPTLKNKINFVEHHLKKNKYLMGDHFTLPDAYLFTILNWLPGFEIPISTWPNIERYFNELKKRKSIEQSLKEEGLQ